MLCGGFGIEKTLNWRRLARFEDQMNIVPLKTIFLVQNANELLALNCKLCYESHLVGKCHSIVHTCPKVYRSLVHP